MTSEYGALSHVLLLRIVELYGRVLNLWSLKKQPQILPEPLTECLLAQVQGSKEPEGCVGFRLTHSHKAGMADEGGFRVLRYVGV